MPDQIPQQPAANGPKKPNSVQTERQEKGESTIRSAVERLQQVP